MSTRDNPTVRNAVVSGHAIRSVVAIDEPEHQRARALGDLATALPSPEALAARDAVAGRIVTTPDFHPGKPVPVGVVADIEGAVIPHLIGNDIGCGMRMIVLDRIGESDLGPDLEKHLRHVFFQGGRDIALTGKNRHAILRHGVPGLLESLSGERRGLLARLDLAAAWNDVARMSDDGNFHADSIDPDFADYAAPDDRHRHDAILGTIGGGNHFVEFGMVERIADGGFAHLAGLKADSVVVVVHSGSLDFGQRIGTATRERTCLQATGARDGILSQARDCDLYRRFLNGHANAANVAFVNRFLIGLAAVEALSRTIGRQVEHRLVYDAPHNTVWENGSTVRHRKGACPARGTTALKSSPYEWTGEPVILPGSMGDGTWLLRGLGSEEGMESSAHGAGRRLSRREARVAKTTLSGLRVVGPIDTEDPIIRGRADILAELKGRLNEEAPAAYRPIDQVVDPMVADGLVARVARIRPILTIKG
ncbi:RtcB family protein [Ensifer adhaerens]|uniref:RtcB family protein n=1 Tax=Ensifer adhaerens TaxID=106592 RepID=UPI001CBBE13E|nr:RtcB family protein [Ensifer adhaerens]MBZ7924433.1 RtcB family protein [Ensifer adhaerens]UAX96323.1 RtcB family protein [Ensifer adhaerens]UAY04334.1 RtcB family protein [Ensifer adhaerens]UAY12319.1 RtcB family protein [Ensifer adhaerens]